MGVWDLSNLRHRIRSALLFILPRYPLIQALTLLMFVAERAQKNSDPPFLPNAIYIYIGTMFVCSVGMGVHSTKSSFAILTSILMFSSAGIMYLNESLQFRKWVKIRIASGMMGVGATFLFFAYFNLSKPRSQFLKRLAEISTGLTTALSCYILFKSPEDKNTFLSFVPLGQASLIIFLFILGATSLCYIMSIQVLKFNVVLCVLYLFKLICIDMRLSYWHSKRGIDYWNQVRMVLDNVTVILGTIFYFTCFKRSEHLKSQ